MKKFYSLKSLLAASLFAFSSVITIAQPSAGGLPQSFFLAKTVTLQPLTEQLLSTPDPEQLRMLDGEDEKTGALRKIGRSVSVSLSPQNSGVWDYLPDGSKLWRLKLRLPAAKAVGVYYDQFLLPAGSRLFLYNEHKTQILGAYSFDNNPSGGQFANELVEGEAVTLEYFQPAGVTLQPILNITELGFIYRDYEPRFDRDAARDFGDSETCEVNVNCSEGTAWQSQKRSVVRILVKQGASYGWCSGALVNNTALNCAPYILTADHCGGNGASTTADLNQWVFYFNYEAAGCSDPASEGSLASQSMTGCTLKARGGQSGTIGSTSDFYLVLLNASVPTAYNPYYAGWSRVNTTSTSGVSIHHPAGDIKKISTYSTSLVADKWTGGTINGTHWRVVWAATANGHGVTEGGSSGSPIFNSSGLVIGQLSGGSSYCTATSSPDLYGAFWYDWDMNTFPATNNKLKPWLDPGNTGVTTLAGTNAPCGPSAPVANFSANNTTPCIGSTVIFTDLSTGSPTSWAWSFSPTTVTYVGGTSSTSQNPQVQFNAAGPYTVTLVATNGIGSDSEVKTAYIAPVTSGTLPFVENFEAAAFPPAGWSRVSADGAGVAWGTDGIHQFERRAAAGNTGSTAGSAAVNCFNYNTDTTQVDELISRAISLVGSTSPTMTFKRAYKSYGTAPWLDELRVYVSSDCGATWGSPVYYKKGNALATSGVLATAFTPSVAADWDIDTVNLSAYVGQNIKVKFAVTNKYGNNLYIDDVNINSSALVASVTITSSDGDNVICAGSSVTFTATPVNGGSSPSYQWQVNGVNVGTNSPTYTTTTLTSGQTVTCIMTSSLSGVSGSPDTSNGITMTVNPVPATPTASSSSPDCTGSTISLSTPAVTGATYSWTGPASFTSSVQNPSRPSATAAMAGTYSVTVTVGGCTSAAGTTAVVINPTPATPTASSSSPDCAGTTLSLSTPAVTGATYSWTGPASFTSTVQNPTRPSATVAMSGTYSVTVTVGGCTSAAGTTTVTVNAVPATPTASSSSPDCAGTTLSLSTPAVTGATYSWTGPGSFTSTTQNPTRPSATAAMAGTYSVTVTVGGCTSAAGTTTVVINPAPTVAATGGTSICAGNSATLNATGATTYSWSGGAGTTASVSVSPTTTTTYTVTGTSSGCSSTATVTVTVNPLPTVSSNSVTICAGSTATLSATGGSTYAWSTGENTGSISVAPASTTSYTVSGTSSAGCSNTAVSTVTVVSAPATPSITQSGLTLTSSSSTGNQWYLDGNPISGATGQTYTASANGTYTVIVSAGSCSSDPSAPIVLTSVGVSDQGDAFALMVFPNPSDGIFNLQFVGIADEYDIQVMNALGQIVYSSKAYPANGIVSSEIDISQYGAGVFILTVSDDEKRSVRSIIQK
jgi:PKD repeat protein